MTRINTNVSSLVAQNRLAGSNNDLNTALTRLSTGLRINKGSDDPAGLIASEALRSEVTSISKSISNTQRASQIIGTADSALSEVSSLLNDIRGLVVEASNTGALSNEEVAANQLQIDSSLEAINRISQTTTFQGRKLLDGSLDFTSTVASQTSVADLSINQAKLGATGQVDVSVDVQAAAEKASLTVADSAFSTPSVATPGQISSFFSSNTYTIDAGGGNSIEIVGNFDSIEINDTPGSSFSTDLTGGKLTITHDSTDNTTLFHLGNTLDSTTNLAFNITGSGISTLPAGSVAETATTGTVNSELRVTRSDGQDFTIGYVDDGIATGVTAFYDVGLNFLSVSIGTNVDSSELFVVANEITNWSTGQPFTFDAEVLTEGGSAAGFDITYQRRTAAELTAGIPPATVETGLTDDLVFQLNGTNGAETFNFGAGTTKEQIAAAVNLVSDSTGVTADATGELTFTSNTYGSDSLVSLELIKEGAAGEFANALTTRRDNGSDIVASVNGVQANGKGNTFSINTSTLDLSLTVDEGSSADVNFSITGGGANFQLGPDVISTQQARLAIGNVSTGQLGGVSGRLYELGSGQAKSLTADAAGAAKIIDEAIEKLSQTRGRLGAFQATTLESNLTSLNEMRANLMEADSSIRDADFASESAALTRAQILVQSGTNVLSLANQNPQNVLSLLG